MAHPGVVQCTTCTTLHSNLEYLLDVHPTNIMLWEDFFFFNHTYPPLEQLSFGKILNLAKSPCLGSAVLIWKLGPGSWTPSHTLAYHQMVLLLSQGGRGCTKIIVLECLFPSICDELRVSSCWI